MSNYTRQEAIFRIFRQRRSIAPLAIFFIAACAPAFAQQNSLPRAPGATVFTLTPQPGFFTEPSVAVNPRNPQQVVVAFQNQASIAYSTDAGAHWQRAQGTSSRRYRVSGDVSAAYDNKGHAILCYMAFDKLGTYSYWAHDSSRNGVFIRRSLDGGRTWEKNDIAILQHPTKPGVPWEDKPYIVADDSHGPYAGNLYVGWTRWTLTNSLILFSRSMDGGKTWSKPAEIDRHPGLPRDDNGALEGFDGAVGPDSALYVVWTEGRHIVLTISRDGGRSFDSPRNIIDTAPAFFQVTGVSRSNGFPQIALDPRGGKLYITWSDYRNGDVDVFCSNSSDHGKAWSPAVRVNSDPLHDGDDQFFQWLAVDPVTGALNVMFYDRRGDPQNKKQIVTLARSVDGGRSFKNYAWTVKPFDAQGVFMGDYTGLAAYNGRVYGAWTMKPAVPDPPGEPDEEEPGESSLTRSPAYWKTHGTVLRVGAADFGAADRKE